MIAIGFYEGYSVLSKIIKWETRSTISHVSIMCLPDLTFDAAADTIHWEAMQAALKTCPLWEAWGGAGVVKRVGIHDGHKPDTKIRLLRLDAARGFPRVDEIAVIHMLEDCIRRKIGYDWWGLVRFGLRINRNNEKRMFCSELVHLAMQAGGAPLLKRVGAHFVSPADLYRSPLLTELMVTKTKG
jgi:hypothetical protein